MTIDAAAASARLSAGVIAPQAYYVLAVKGDKGLLAEQVRDSFLLLEHAAVSEEIDCGPGHVC